MLREHRIDCALGGRDEDVEAYGLMHEVAAVVDGLPGQARAQVARIAFQHAELPHHVMQHLVAAAEAVLFTVEP